MCATQLVPDLSIVIPAYREEKRIGKTLEALAAFLRADALLRDIRVQVIVVCADAPDATRQIVQQKAVLFQDFTLVAPGPRVGKGRDVRAGMLRAQGSAVLFMDADLATPLSHIPQFYALYQQGAEVIIATRDLHAYRGGLMRASISIAGNVLYRLAGGGWIEDSQCGFKMFSERAARICFQRLRIMGWGFDMEVLAFARANKLVLKTVRVSDWQAVPDGTFEEGVLKNSLQSLKDLAIIFWRRCTGFYEAGGN